MVPAGVRVLLAARGGPAAGHDPQGPGADQPRPGAARACCPRWSTGPCTPARCSSGWWRPSATSCSTRSSRRTVKFPETSVAGVPITAYAPDQRRRRGLPAAGARGAGPDRARQRPGRRRPSRRRTRRTRRIPSRPARAEQLGLDDPLRRSDESVTGERPASAMVEPEPPAGPAPGARRRSHAGVRRPGRRLRGSVRPAAEPDRQAPHRGHRAGAARRHRRLHRPRARPGRGVGPRRGHLLPGHRRHPAGPQGGPAAARRRRSRTRRISPCWRPGTCCSPGCCSTGRSRRSPPCSTGCSPMRRPAGARGTPPSSLAGRAAARGAAGHRTGPSSPRSPRRPSLPSRRIRGCRSSTSMRRRSACASRRRSWSSGCAGAGVATFRALTADAPSTLVVVGRFLALLELYRDGSVTFEQAAALGDLTRALGRPGRRRGGRGGRTGGGRRVRRAVAARRVRRGGGWAHARCRRGGPAMTVGDPGRTAHGDGAGTGLLPERSAPRPRGGLRGGAAAGRPAAGPADAGQRRAPAGGRGRGGGARALPQQYTDDGRGFDLREVAGGWRFYTRDDCADVVSRLRRRRPAGTADAGGSGDAGDHRLPAADLARPDQRGARGERRRGRADADQPGPGHRGRRRAGRPGDACWAPPPYFLERLGISDLVGAPAARRSRARPTQELGDLVDLP